MNKILEELLVKFPGLRARDARSPNKSRVLEMWDVGDGYSYNCQSQGWGHFFFNEGVTVEKDMMGKDSVFVGLAEMSTFDQSPMPLKSSDSVVDISVAAGVDHMVPLKARKAPRPGAWGVGGVFKVNAMELGVDVFESAGSFYDPNSTYGIYLRSQHRVNGKYTNNNRSQWCCGCRIHNYSAYKTYERKN